MFRYDSPGLNGRGGSHAFLGLASPYQHWSQRDFDAEYIWGLLAMRLTAPAPTASTASNNQKEYIYIYKTIDQYVIMSLEILSINNNSQNCSTDIGGNETSYADPLVIKDDDDEQSIMSLHRECKDDGMYDTSAADNSIVVTTTTLTTPLENNPQRKDHLPQQQQPLPPQPQQLGTDVDANHITASNSSTHADDDSAATLTPPLPIMIVSNKCETVFVSSDGDVLTSRCRHTPYPTWSASSSSMGDGSGASHHHHSNSSNTNGSNTAIGAFPVLAAVVCCDNSTYHRNHTGYSHNNGDDRGFTNSPHRHDQNASPIIHPYTDSRHNNHNDFNDVNETTTSVINHTSVSNDVHRGDVEPSDTASGNGTLLFMKSFDQSQFSEMGALDETPWMAPISRQNDNVPNVTTTATSTARTDPQQNHPNRSNSGSTAKAAPRRLQQPLQLFHGVPTFVSYFSSIKIRHVSAHVTGAHVLLISHPGILYAYGLNTYGQLGIGFKSHSRDVHQGYVMRPTIVTSLLENGGKTIACAAGVSHSLVVVEVEQQRMIKSRSLEMVTQKQPRGTSSSVLRTRQQSDATNTTATTTGLQESEIVKYHQIYGFGRNDYMKIGLVSPTRDMSLPKSSNGSNATTTMPGTDSLATNQNTMIDQNECVLFPRRVALRCSVIHKKLDGASSISKVNEFPPKGIFAIAASSEHSAALVHQPNGDIELYTWGNATYGTLGLPPSATSTTITTTTAVFRIAPYPSLVACLCKTSNTEVQAHQLLRNDRNEFPMTMSLSRCCSFVVTNIGRIFSFGTSEDGMLGLGRSVSETQTPMEVLLPEDARHEKVISVSAGTLHVTVCTNAGHVYSWGARSHAGFDIQTSSNSSLQQNHKAPTIMKGPTPIEDLIQFEWSPRHVEFSNSTIHGRSKHYSHSDGIPKQPPKIVQARAGNDCTFFVTDCGKVLSSGKSSGRFGQGEYDADVTIPKPLFGGLHLFQQKENNLTSSGMSNDSNNDNDNTHPQATTTSLRSKARRLASV